MSEKVMPDNWREQWIDWIRSAGESITENAESIVGTEQKLANVSVTVSIYPGEIPTITVSRDFYPKDI